MTRKRTMDDHREDTRARAANERPPLFLVLDNIRSLTNVGAIFRAADGMGVRKIFICGITPAPPRPEIAKISLGAEDTTPFEVLADPAKAVRILQHEGVTVLCCEQTDRSTSIYETAFPRPLALVRARVGLHLRGGAAQDISASAIRRRSARSRVRGSGCGLQERQRRRVVPGRADEPRRLVFDEPPPPVEL